MKHIKKIILTSILLIVFVETGLLINTAHKYLKYKMCSNTFNGRIISYIDYTFDFSGWKIK